MMFWRSIILACFSLASFVVSHSLQIRRAAASPLHVGNEVFGIEIIIPNTVIVRFFLVLGVWLAALAVHNVFLSYSASRLLKWADSAENLRAKRYAENNNSERNRLAQLEADCERRCDNIKAQKGWSYLWLFVALLLTLPGLFLYL